jgi:hypothetical protein
MYIVIAFFFNSNYPSLPLPEVFVSQQEHTRQTLSFKERKDIFNKQNLLYSSGTKNKEHAHNTSPPTMPSNHKRQKIEAPVCSPGKQSMPIRPTTAATTGIVGIDFNKVENKENNEIVSSSSSVGSTSISPSKKTSVTRAR